MMTGLHLCAYSARASPPRAALGAVRASGARSVAAVAGGAVGDGRAHRAALGVGRARTVRARCRTAEAEGATGRACAALGVVQALEASGVAADLTGAGDT